MVENLSNIIIFNNLDYIQEKKTPFHVKIGISG